MLLKNLFPNPSPLEAPFTIPAISVNSNVVGIVFFGCTISVNTSNLLSGTSTMPTLGSIVANGLFAASAPALVIALKSVDLPTLGKPTIPAVKDIIHSPYFQYLDEILIFFLVFY